MASPSSVTAGTAAAAAAASIEDIFDSSLNLEESHLNDGFTEGYNAGLISGREEAKQVGLKFGFQVGEELGFYRGCVDVWNSAIEVDSTRFSSRVQRNIKQMEELLRKYPFSDPEDESTHEIMDVCEASKEAERMLRLMLGCCKVYISESRNRAALESIERAAKLFPEARIINKFEDESYNRVGYILVSKLAPNPSSDVCALRGAVLAMVKAAFEAINLETHCGNHPRLGVVDHICFHPLADASLNQTAGIAKSLAADIGSNLQVPTFLYGAAHEEERTLDSIRRELGYFKPNSSGNQWAGGMISESSLLKPDVGPAKAPQAKGVVVIGSTRWVDNYNVPIFSANIAAVRRIAKRVSGRGGGLPSVQAMALAYGENVIEVACNLLEPSRIGGDQVQLKVEQQAEEEGVVAGKGYYTDFSQEKMIERYLEFDPLCKQKNV